MKKMNVVIILAHPRQGSFNHAVADSAARMLISRGHVPLVHDLYQESFDPLLTADEMGKECAVEPVLRQYCDELVHAHGIIFVHPNWWGQPPAILKGWIDRVIRPGVGYEFLEGDGGEGMPKGLLSGKTALVFNTSDTPEKREKEFFGDPLEMIWKRCIFEFCGITKYFRRTFSVVVTSSREQRALWLDEVRDAVVRFFP